MVRRRERLGRDPIFERAVAAVVEVPGVEVPTLQRVAGVVSAIEALEGAGLRLVLVAADEIVIRRKYERRRWWRKEER